MRRLPLCLFGAAATALGALAAAQAQSPDVGGPDIPPMTETGATERPAMADPENLGAEAEARAMPDEDRMGPAIDEMPEPAQIQPGPEGDGDAPLSVVETPPAGSEATAAAPTHRVVVIEFGPEGARAIASYEADGPAPEPKGGVGAYAYVAEREGADATAEAVAGGSILDPLVGYASEDIPEGGVAVRGHSVSRVSSGIATISTPADMTSLRVFRVPPDVPASAALAPQGFARLAERSQTVLEISREELLDLPDAARPEAYQERMQAPTLEPQPAPNE